MLITTIKTIHKGKKKLDTFTYYERMSSISPIILKQNKKFSNWLNEYRENIPERWDLALEAFEKERSSKIEEIIKLKKHINDFILNYLNVKQNIRTLLDLGPSSTWSSSGNTINNFWNIWFDLPSSIKEITGYGGEIWRNSIAFMLNPNKQKKFLEGMNAIDRLSELKRKQDYWFEKFKIEHFSHVSPDLKRFNNESKILILKKYEDEYPIVRKFLSEYLQKFRSGIEPVLKFQTSDNYLSSDRRICVYDERVKLIDVISNIIKHHNELNEYCDKFCEQSDSYIKILEESFYHLRKKGILAQIKEILQVK